MRRSEEAFPGPFVKGLLPVQDQFSSFAITHAKQQTQGWRFLKPSPLQLKRQTQRVRQQNLAISPQKIKTKPSSARHLFFFSSPEKFF